MPWGGVESYLQNSYVSLKSAKLSNPGVDVALITNQKLPIKYESLFNEAEINILIVPFDCYQMPDSFSWQYAFYKLCVLDYIVNNDKYDCVLGLDTDTYVNGNLDSLWDECRYNLPILYDLGTLGKVRKQIEMDYVKLTKCTKYIQQIGGEFIAGSKQGIRILSRQNALVYQKIVSSDFNIAQNSGDEAILSMAASEISYVSGRPFIRRYWTRKAYYNADYVSEYVPIWHLPAEKNYGLLKAFRTLKNKNCLPKTVKMMRLFNLPRQNPYNISMLKYYAFRIVHYL